MAKYEQREGTVLGAIEEALSIAEELRDELQDWYDNLPESFQNGDKGSELQEAIDQMEEAISALEDAQGADAEEVHNLPITYQQIVYPKSEYMSRSKRLALSLCALEGVPTDLDWVLVPEDNESDAEEVLERCTEALDLLQSVSFPRMY